MLHNAQEKKNSEAISHPTEVLHFLLKKEMDDVNLLIEKRLQSKVSLIPEIAKHLIYSGGKRLRPLLTLASAKLCHYSGSSDILLAAAVEFIHTATLLHDDVVDQSDLRRGKPSANAIWGNKPSVLVGDFLFSRSFELMVEADSMEVLGVLSKASSQIAEGEVAQLLTTHNLATTQADYLHVIESKTAQLFAAATRIGPILAGLDPKKKNDLEKFGLYLGIAFQLVDDVLDYKTDDPLLGKKKGNDFAEGKVTLPVILAYQQGNDVERKFWSRTFEKVEIEPEDLNQAIAYFEKYNALQKSLDLASDYKDKALSYLDNFDESPIRNALVQLTQFVVERQF